MHNISARTPMGATLVDGGATFRTWAPNATAVWVLGDFNSFTRADDSELVPDGEGHWRGFIPGVIEGQSYKFWITGQDGAGYKRDPYAREIHGTDQHCVIRSAAFAWHETGFSTPRFPDFVIYQLHVGAFHAPRCPPFAGTFLDVMDKIPYLSDLGVTALQLLPIQEFPGRFSLGYNGTDYFAPEPAFAVSDADLPSYLARANQLLGAKGLLPYTRQDVRGESNQLKALVDVCHAYGLAVILDLVFNHAGGNFGTESLWFFDRQRGASDSPPQYWNSLYFSDRTWAGGNVFNFGVDGVRQFLIDNARFLLEEYRVDGFRFDEVSVIDSNGYGRGWDFCQALTGTLRACRPAAIQHAEYWPVNPWVVRDPFDAGAGFDTTLTDGLRIALRNLLACAASPDEQPLPMTALGRQLSPGYLHNLWRGVQGTENHDLVLQPKEPHDHDRMERMARVADPANPRSWWARSRSRVATGLVLTAPGIPMLFMGQEFLEDKQWSDDVIDHPELLLYWDGLGAPDPSMRDFLRFTRELIALRRQLPALRGEGFRLVHAHDLNRVLAFHRWVPGEGYDIIVVAHFANSNQHGYRIGFPSGGTWQEAFNSDVYDNWVNPQVAGNGGEVCAVAAPLHDFDYSAPLTLPANALLVFARTRGRGS
ncbi:MAG: alpha-amylase family glycosyl hydrolase [Steroidobacteraceae bacterium]